MDNTYQKLLRATLEVQSKSEKEKQMKKFIRKYLKDQGLDTEHDNMGNIYCHKGDKRRNRPFVVAHMDTVHELIPDRDYMVVETDEFYCAYNRTTMKQVGVGGDDKVGVWAALAALTEFDNISAAFMVKEEIGCLGSNGADLKQFARANWLAQLDRRGASEFIVYRMASKEFIDDMKPLAEMHGMEVKDQSTITDVSTLYRRKVGVSAVNIASGYWYPHTPQEVVNITDAVISLHLLFKMIEGYGENKYPHLPPKPQPRPKGENLPAARSHPGSGKPMGYKSYDRNERDTSTDDFEMVGDKMRMWNAFYGCYEWRGRNYEVLFYEGTDKDLGIFSNNPRSVGSLRMKPAKKDTLSTFLPLRHELQAQERVDLTAVSDETEKMDKYGMPTGTASGSLDDAADFDDIDAYLDYREKDRLAREEADMEAIAEASGVDNSDLTRRDYHHFDVEYANEVHMGRRAVDSVLFLYGFSFSDLTEGQIPDTIIYNMSASLFHDTQNTMRHYARALRFEDMYSSDALDNTGSFANFEKREGDLPF